MDIASQIEPSCLALCAVAATQEGLEASRRSFVQPGKHRADYLAIPCGITVKPLKDMCRKVRQHKMRRGVTGSPTPGAFIAGKIRTATRGRALV